MDNRIVSIDVFRGLLILMMTFIHLSLFPFMSIELFGVWISNYVFNPFGYFSVAEGFFFLAGLSGGCLYAKQVANGNLLKLWPRVRKRIAQIYGIHLILLFSFSLLLTVSPSYLENWQYIAQNKAFVNGYKYFLEHPWIGFGLGSVFLYPPSFFDILPMFIFFLIITPFVINQLLEGRVGLVLGISACCWLMTQFLPANLLESSLSEYIPCKLGWFNFLAVQILFVSGLTIGFVYKKDTSFKLTYLILLSGLFLLISYVVLELTVGAMNNPNCLGWSGLVVFAAKALLAFSIAHLIKIRPLALLGSHSLPVFTYHIILVYGLVFFLGEISSLTLMWRLFFLVILLATIWLPAHALEKYHKLGTHVI